MTDPKHEHAYCTDPRHGTPCPLPCEACEEECDETYKRIKTPSKRAPSPAVGMSDGEKGQDPRDALIETLRSAIADLLIERELTRRDEARKGGGK